MRHYYFLWIISSSCTYCHFWCRSIFFPLKARLSLYCLTFLIYSYILFFHFHFLFSLLSSQSLSYSVLTGLSCSDTCSNHVPPPIINYSFFCHTQCVSVFHLSWSPAWHMQERWRNFFICFKRIFKAKPQDFSCSM